MTHTCCATIYTISRWRGSACGKTARFEREGKWYCGTHDPVSRRERMERQDAERQAQWRIRQASQDRAAARAEFNREAGTLVRQLAEATAADFDVIRNAAVALTTKYQEVLK